MESNISKSKQIDSIIVIVMLFLNIGSVLVFPFQNIILNNIFRIPVLILILLLILRKYKESYPKYIVPLITIFIICLNNIVKNPESLNFDLIISIASVFGLLFLVIISQSIIITRSLRNSIFILSVVASGVLTYHAFGPFAHIRMTSSGYIGYTEYLTMGFGNSNLSGIITLLIFSCTWISASYKSFWNKLFTFCVSLWLLFLIFETNCRSAFFAAIIVPIASIVFRYVRIRNWIIYLFCAIPFIFVPLYINYSMEADTEEELMNKSIVSGRDEIYKDALDRFNTWDEYLTGSFSDQAFYNAHNAPLAIYVSLGLIGCFAYYYIMIDRLRLDNRFSNTFTSKAAILSILSIFVESCGEASLFLGGFPCLVFFFIIYLLATYNGNIDSSKSAY